MHYLYNVQASNDISCNVKLNLCLFYKTNIILFMDTIFVNMFLKLSLAPYCLMPEAIHPVS